MAETLPTSSTASSECFHLQAPLLMENSDDSEAHTIGFPISKEVPLFQAIPLASPSQEWAAHMITTGICAASGVSQTI